MSCPPSGQGHRKHTTVKAKAYSEGYVWTGHTKKRQMHCFGELCIPHLKCYSRSKACANIHTGTSFSAFVNSFTEASKHFLMLSSIFVRTHSTTKIF